MKNAAMCEVCGRRAKLWPKQQGKSLCMRHWNLYVKDETKFNIVLENKIKRDKNK